ncbi:16S rRNA (cytosine(967)-C(5))-methyltransferase RsmB [Bacillus sp. ISL-47]|uniref:16S rRNA (cytosine(967)-C(5))-methyltransferase RsmB n=1 Tax=Bacillus sp. ISL-47 TaxID=2819130 RepID=UPI001BE8E710|nr:16S rRNA (cytosine(967)-C(5))-methyltransferase RsmB [Bacillus sp. ISL-47]MBT2687982.1 16S rRNA (cytosine(967)-C(5))-methyltransferase RsmB [Bacillus sp. ISL-47]MBT2708251.1 16S rRNA (cytosine(967)-C(5))-methyltransferase RsmB [Pseudomonas sp. ISL-84]
MKNQKTKNVRETALELLEAIEKNQSYSNLLLNNAIKKNEISQKDIGLLTELIYGTLQRRMTLDFYLNPFLKGNKKVESWVKQLLRLTLYQMVYLDKIPDRAAIFEAVEIAKRKGHKGISGMVNGVLRNVQRQGLPSLEQIEDPVERLSIETSHPMWLVKRWVEQLGYEETKKMCEVNLTAPLQTARVNEVKASREECLTLLEEEGYEVEASPFIPVAIKCLRGHLANSQIFREGLITIQDESSMLVAYALGGNENETVLDACAAPGGKSTHIAEKLQNTGQVVSLDLHEHKVKLINDNARRLGLSNIKTNALDSRKVQEHFEKESFDRILVDAPCSGLGVMRRKPDMKYTKKEEDLYHLHKVQRNLLAAVSPLLKKGGILVYSTCTVDKEENQHVVQSFLNEHAEFEGDISVRERMPKPVAPFIDGYELQILPQDIGSDGFYIACLRKKVQ